MNPVTMILSALTTLFGWFKERAEKTQDLKLAEIEAKKQMVLSKQMALAQWELAQLVDKDKPLRVLSFVLFSSPFWSGFFGPTFHQYTLSLWHSLSPFQENILAMICAAVFGRKTIPNFIGGTIQALAGGLRKPPQLPEPRETVKN